MLSLDPRDHPRGCGENLPFESVVWKEKGSPPRMRGKLAAASALAVAAGITPADAGKTGKVYDSVRAC